VKRLRLLRLVLLHRFSQQFLYNILLSLAEDMVVVMVPVAVVLVDIAHR
jgi:hypothetical protein